MSAFSSMLTAIYNKILTTDTRLPTISFTETVDNLKETYPRVEVSIIKFRGNSYISQREMQWSCFYKVVGYLEKPHDDGNILIERTQQEAIDIINYAIKTVNSIYSLHDDKQNGFITIPSFQQFGEFPEVWTDLELLPSLASFAFQLEAQFILNDTAEE